MQGYIHSRGYLPHVEGASIQFITYRLAESIPKDMLSQVVKYKDSNIRKARIEELLDSGLGSCLLKESGCAKIVIDNWKYFDGVDYKILAFVVMPNHVHILIQLLDDKALSKIIWNWKSYTSKAILKLNPEQYSPVWMRDYWDRYIRDENHLAASIEYIHNNPVKAGLVENITEWPWSSAAGSN